MNGHGVNEAINEFEVKCPRTLCYMEIDRKRIEDWAMEYSAQSDFPLLIAKMVYATILPGDYANIPWGSAVNIGGWDGIVNSEKGAGFIPAGRSIIEFGTNKTPKTKAEKDYSSRTNREDEVIERSQTTFIFMTPRCWEGCEKWQEVKRKEGIWKDVRVYDSRGISTLLLGMESVSCWFARKLNLPVDGCVLDVERYWEEGIISPEVRLNPRFFVAGRTNQLDRLQEISSNEIPIIGVAASSKEEALEFIIAAGMSFSGDNNRRFISKALVVTDVNALRSLPLNQGLIIIPTFEDARPLYYQAISGNCVLIPLGADTDYKNETIELSRPDKFELVKALDECGLDHERAERVVRDAACSISAIKKELGFFVQRAEWLNDENVAELFAALLCGRWNEQYEGDRRILETLSGMPFDDYKFILDRWSRKPLSPVLQIGSTWRLVSPLSLWIDLAKILPSNWKKILSEVCERVFLCCDNELSYSSQLRDGLLQSLIIIALFGHRIRIDDNGQDYVNCIIKKILEPDTEQQWTHIHSSLALIAEAAPDVFIEYVQKAIKNPTGPILSLFKEKSGILFPESNHTDLLWSLERLAWIPDYLKEVTELLFELSDKDPGGKLENRPFNSLIEIFNPWVPQTSVCLDDRLYILRDCLKMKYHRMWDLLLALFPKRGFSIMETPKLKWRKYDCIMHQEDPSISSYKFTLEAIKMLEESYDGSDEKMAKLLVNIVALPIGIRGDIIKWIGESVKSFNGDAPETLKALRDLLWHQGVYGNRSTNVLDRDELIIIQSAYNSLLPEDIVQRNLWLFDDFYPHLPIPNNDVSDIEKSNAECIRQRKEACDLWLSELGVEKTIDLRQNIGAPITLGSILALFDEPTIWSNVVSLLSNEDDFPFVCSYLSEKEGIIGEKAIIELYKVFAKEHIIDESVLFLCCLNQTLSLWSFLESLPQAIQVSYWQRVNVHFVGPDTQKVLFAVDKLCKVGRAITAMNGSWHYAEIMSTNTLDKVLHQALDCSLELNSIIDYLSAETFLDELHKRKDRDEQSLEALEWYYLPLMRHHPKRANVELLVKRLNNDHTFFVELLTYLFTPDDEELEFRDDQDVKEVEKRKANAERTYELFDQWKEIPGVDSRGIVNTQILSSWLKNALNYATQSHRQKGALIQLGKLFSQYPEESEYWPSMELFSIMESIESDVFYRNYESAMFNKRGFTSRGAYDGGNIERENAQYFRHLSHSCVVTCPKVARVFNRLAKQYEEMAKDIDNEASIAKLDY